jgi:hypothetical protein
LFCYFWLDPKVTKRSRLKLASYSVPSGSLSPAKLASLRQRRLRALTPVTALYARQLRPILESGAFSWDGRYRLFFCECSILPVLLQMPILPAFLRSRIKCGKRGALSPCLTRGRRRTGGIGNPKRAVRLYFRPKRMGVKRRAKTERQEPALSERSEFRRRQRSL